MKKEKMKEEEDDGRTIADMSGLDRPSPFGIPQKKKRKPSGVPEGERSAPLLNKEERGAFILGALGAALLIGLVFMGGIGLAILIMLLLWR